jgi:ABC-type lipoprotein release transport system permease subunit
MAIPISYNVRSVFARPVSTLTTMVGIGFTVAILIGALALAAGFQQALIQTGRDDNVLVLRRSADSEISSGLSRDAVNVIRAWPGIATAPDGRPLVSAEVVVLTNKPRLGQPGSSNLTVRGIDPEAAAFRDQVKVTEGRMFSPGADEIVVGRRIVPRFAGLRIGDRIRFGQRDFRVVGHFTAGGSGFESEVWGDNKVLMPVFRGDVFQSVTFRMQDPARFEAIRSALEHDPRLGVDAHRESEYYRSQSELLATVIRVAGVFIVIIMAVGAVFGAMNTMYAAIGARTREIATLLILGFSPGAVLVSFMIESVFLALLGGLLGCLIALPINGMVTSTTNFSSFSELAFAFRVTGTALLTGMVFAGVLGVVGGFLPALRAARQPLAAALRSE